MNIQLTEAQIKNFHRGYNKLSDTECWTWLGYKQSSGHGQVRIGTKTLYAHRVAYLLVFGSFDDSLCVCHKCDNGSCVNPSHLFLGTKDDNAKDRIAKGRSAGIWNCGILSEEEVKEIIRLYKETSLTQKSIARRFKINPCQVSRIVNGRRWGHLQPDAGTEPAT